MINYIANLCLYLLSANCYFKEYNLVFIISSVLNSLICILLIPVAIRLAGQLIAQVFKYRYIVNNCIRDCDDDKKVITSDVLGGSSGGLRPPTYFARGGAYILGGALLPTSYL